MSENGYRIEAPAAAGSHEAAAIVAAVERFIAETTAVAEPAPAANPWQQAALREGVAAKAAFGPLIVPRDPWG